mmetsp:Transcript_14745/g.18502  ORF Transcript_14745/g.18502 Transcript_14745/m.18502 type:complete len:134 (-) Transcript_14745:254-655(-)
MVELIRLVRIKVPTDLYQVLASTPPRVPVRLTLNQVPVQLKSLTHLPVIVVSTSPDLLIVAKSESASSLSAAIICVLPGSTPNTVDAHVVQIVTTVFITGFLGCCCQNPRLKSRLIIILIALASSRSCSSLDL